MTDILSKMQTEHYLTFFIFSNQQVSPESSVKRKAYDSTLLSAVILLQNLGGNADFFVPFQIFSEKGLFVFLKSTTNKDKNGEVHQEVT